MKCEGDIIYIFVSITYYTILYYTIFSGPNLFKYDKLQYCTYIRENVSFESLVRRHFVLEIVRANRRRKRNIWLEHTTHVPLLCSPPQRPYTNQINGRPGDDRSRLTKIATTMTTKIKSNNHDYKTKLKLIFAICSSGFATIAKMTTFTYRFHILWHLES